jgi:hypothetical protein
LVLKTKTTLAPKKTFEGRLSSEARNSPLWTVQYFLTKTASWAINTPEHNP